MTPWRAFVRRARVRTQIANAFLGARHAPPRFLHAAYRKRRQAGVIHFDVVYVGMASRGSIRARLKNHRRKKAGFWTHFSVFEVWDNIRDEEVRELEGLFRHLYRDDSKASPLNAARGYKALRTLRNNRLDKWSTTES